MVEFRVVLSERAATKRQLIKRNVAGRLDRVRAVDFRSQLASLMSDDPQPQQPRVTEVSGLTERRSRNNSLIDWRDTASASARPATVSL